MSGASYVVLFGFTGTGWSSTVQRCPPISRRRVRRFPAPEARAGKRRADPGQGGPPPTCGRRVGWERAKRHAASPTGAHTNSPIPYLAGEYDSGKIVCGWR